MRQVLFLPILVFITMVNTVAAEDKVSEFKTLFVESMNSGLKCHAGFKKIPDRLIAAAEACAQNKEITNYLVIYITNIIIIIITIIVCMFQCYLTCMYRHYGYIKPETSEIDYTVGDIVTMEAFDLETPEGRDSYWKIALHRYECGRDCKYINKQAVWIVNY